VLSTVEFDSSGDFLATGDKGGRIVIFERADAGRGRKRPRALGLGLGRRRHASGGAGGSDDDDDDEDDARVAGAEDDGGAAPAPEFRFLTEFQSHESEFDYLKSQEIEEKINQVAWCKRATSSLLLLSTNDKTIKLWKVHDKTVRMAASLNVEVGRYGGRVPVSHLRIPSLVRGEAQTVATPRRIFSNAHMYHINSISVNSDGATFLSADDLRLNVWSLEHAKLSFNIVDIKPPTLEELTEVITAAAFHPEHAHIFMFSSSRGSVKIGDMREAALCDRQARLLVEDEEDPAAKSYFSEIIASVTDIDFSKDGRRVVARDYLSVKVWDLAMEGRGPVSVVPVHEQLRPKLADLYDSDCIFDRFRVSSSRDGSKVLTGSYNNCCKIFDMAADSETIIELSKTLPKPPLVRRIPMGVGSRVEGAAATADGAGEDGEASGAGAGGVGDLDAAGVDFGRKVLHVSWHPEDDIVAVAGLNDLFLFSG
jgi:serine/threonine-protein phosphatase 2A regulatory subunit B